MEKIIRRLVLIISILISIDASSQRAVVNFNKDWRFFLGDDSAARLSDYDDTKWRFLHLPHDWSIEGNFSKDYPTTFNQGALPAGIGWYRKTFIVPSSSKDKILYIEFDGVYRNSEVWINGHYLGKRPNGYISFRYDLTPFLKWGKKNIIAVRVDNSAQPNSRWYTGSGIYRNVRLVSTNKVAINDPTVFVSAEMVSRNEANVFIRTELINKTPNPQDVTLTYQLRDPSGKIIGTCKAREDLQESSALRNPKNTLKIFDPRLWSPDSPSLYKATIFLTHEDKVLDSHEISFGIRYFHFDSDNGFYLNGKPFKIKGVCMHHDLGALGAALNKRAMERQLRILKEMGCNAIRTAHNPPAPEFLDLCDSMGFLAMDEAFDMWKKRKNRFDYNIDFNEWHKKDLEDMIRRDRNHPSVFMWSIGNEIREQFDSTGTSIARELVAVVKSLDTTRPVTSALTENIPTKNFIYQSGALDVLGFNYKHADYPELPKRFPGEKFIATETASALATRGHYDFPSDSNRIWPPDSKPFTTGNADHTVSSYDHVYAYWGATHEESWKAVKKNDFMSGIFVWSGFDFLGEPVPYQWPSRSSYYGIVDLAGFPKDVYYMYQSEWTSKPVLHIFPHWNWEKGKLVDVWAYYSQADEVELFLNGKSLGTKKKQGDSLHVIWRIAFEPGTLRVISKKNGKIILSKEIKTAGSPAKIQLTADKKVLNAGGEDLSFVEVKILDAENNIVPYADNLVQFKIEGEGALAGVDNGNPVSMESFKEPQRKAFNGMCLLIVRSTGKPGMIHVTATANGLTSSILRINSVNPK